MKYLYLFASLIAFPLNAVKEQDLIKFAQTGSCPGGDLSYAPLTGIINDLRAKGIHKIDLSGANLMGADLSGAQLANANLERAILINANLVHANAQKANLSEAMLIGADFTHADITKADLSYVTLSIGKSINK